MPRGVRQLSALQVQKKEKMSLSFCARAIEASAGGVPAEDVLRLVHPSLYMSELQSASDAYSSKAAGDGMEFTNMLSLHAPAGPRPAAAWGREIHCNQEGSDMLSGRATCMLQEVAKVTRNVCPDYRRMVFGSQLFTFKFQEWFLSATYELCDALVSFLELGPNAVNAWLRGPPGGNWPFPASCRGCLPVRSMGKWSAEVQDWEMAPGASNAAATRSS